MPRAEAATRARVAGLFVVLASSCVSIQEFGAESAPGPRPPPPAAQGPIGEGDEPPTGTWRWQWANPAPTGNALRAINGTADDDVWVAGDGVIAHWNGSAWDRHRTDLPEGQFFALGVRSRSDVWVAEGTADRARVLRYDGKEWVESFPFAGAVFRGFSHGAGSRLFAMVNLGLTELTPEGTWAASPTGTGFLDRGPVADVWVTPRGDAWAITAGALEAPTLLHQRAGQGAWERAGPDLPKGTDGLAISGAAGFGCAFYAKEYEIPGTSTDVGLLFYDQERWHTAFHANKAPAQRLPAGGRSACVRGGGGYLAGERHVLEVRLDELEWRSSPELPIQKNAAWSFDGVHAYVVGDHGLVVRRAWNAKPDQEWQELGPTIRNEIHDVDVGADGAVMAIDSLRTIVPAGREVLAWRDRWTRLSDATTGEGPRTPVALTVIREGSAWVATDEEGRVGVARYTGKWSAPSPLEGTGTGRDHALAIWAPDEDDVWVSGSERCPDRDHALPAPCSKPVASFLAHFDGAAWTTLRTAHPVLSIHGSGRNDVWFAGQGVAHWDGVTLAPVPSLDRRFTGVWSSREGRVWLWGDGAVLYDGATVTPVEQALHAATEWNVTGIAESAAGDVFVLTSRSAGTALLWFDPTRTRLVAQISSSLALTKIGGRRNHLWAIGEGGATLRFTPPTLR